MQNIHMTHIERVDLNLLAPLAALLEERHASRNARQVSLSQPAMSRALQRLRAAPDDELLVRGAEGYRPTPRAVPQPLPHRSDRHRRPPGPARPATAGSRRAAPRQPERSPPCRRPAGHPRHPAGRHSAPAARGTAHQRPRPAVCAHRARSSP
ncbi:LysR family transcriptional regulator [Streptomyces sp. NPDC007971]|uniref:helix-turn-helix domain-containing protein n=1 Tax=Streptomyces sp. NPDC007971 TaxID=3364799 RepID=UPI0036E43B92